MDLQIDDFYHDCAAGLLSLYLSFPRKVALYIDDLIGPEEPDEFGLPSKRQQSCLGALLWLADEGYLRYESTLHYQALDQATLTEKGFIRLTRFIPALVTDSSLPPSIRRQQGTLAHQLRQALHSRDSEQVARLTRLVLDQGSPET